MEHKSYPVFITKLDEEQGIVETVFAVFGNLDKVNDVIHPGAFVKTFVERGGKIKVLDQHRTDSVLSVLGKPRMLRELGRNELPPDLLAKYPEATGGAWSQVQFNLKTQAGHDVFQHFKAGDIDEWSFGYDALDFDYSDVEGVKARNLRTIKLYELSPVVWGANPATVTTSVKMEGKPVEETENTIRIQVRDSDDMQEGSLRTITISEDEGIQALIGKLPGKTTTTIATYIFDKDKWTVEKARAWVEDHRKSATKGVSGKTDWPLADRDRAWDAGAAEGRIRSWAGAEDGPNEKYRSCHFWYDAENADNFTAYKLLFCDVVDGTVRAVPRGVFAVAGVLSGARGGTTIPAGDQDGIKARVSGYYARMRREFDDDSIVSPWEKSQKEGRVLSTANAERIASAVENLIAVLEAAGVEIEAGKAGSGSDITHLPKGAGSCGGPSTDEDLLRIIEIEQEQLKLAEVE